MRICHQHTIPHFVWQLACQAWKSPYDSRHPHPSWEPAVRRKETDEAKNELNAWARQHRIPGIRICVLLMKFSRYRVDSRLWLDCMNLLLFKYFNLPDQPNHLERKTEYE